MTTHAEAKALVDAVVTDAAQSLFLRAQSLLEAHYGDAYPGANNWGSIHESGDAGSFRHTDTDAHGKSYTTSFAKWSTPQKGIEAMARLTVRRQDVADAIAAGDLDEAVRLIGEVHHYFEAPLASYQAGVRRCLNTIVDATGEENPFLEPDELPLDSPLREPWP